MHPPPTMAQLLTRHKVIGPRKHMIIARMKMGNSSPCASVGSEACTWRGVAKEGGTCRHQEKASGRTLGLPSAEKSGEEWEPTFAHTPTSEGTAAAV